MFQRRVSVDFSKLDVLWTCVSSAYRWCLISLASDRTELSEVVYMIKRSSPSTEPWGTPKRSSMGLDLECQTNYNFLHRYFLILVIYYITKTIPNVNSDNSLKSETNLKQYKLQSMNNISSLNIILKLL